MPMPAELKNSVESNKLIWGETHHWSGAGDEWSGQAVVCGTSYDAWKQSLVDHLITPYCGGKDVVEIAPGHGRWTEFLVETANSVHLVDINQTCLEKCKERFGDKQQVSYALTSGSDFPGVADSSIDFVFSFDSFVHMEKEVIGGYFKEFSRTLRPGGIGLIHHANRRMLGLSFLRKYGSKATRLYSILSQGWAKDDDGWRSNVSGDLVAQLAREAGLTVQDQYQYWARPNGVPRYNDLVTVVEKPL